MSQMSQWVKQATGSYGSVGHESNGLANLDDSDGSVH